MTNKTLDPNTQHNLDLVKTKLKEMENQLLSNDPQLPEYLTIIRDDLRQYPEIVYLLTPEEIAPLYKAILTFSKHQVQTKATSRRTRASTTASGQSAASLL